MAEPVRLGMYSAWSQFHALTRLPGWGEEVPLSSVRVVPRWGVVVQPQGLEEEHHASLLVRGAGVCASVYYIIQTGGVCVGVCTHTCVCMCVGVGARVCVGARTCVFECMWVRVCVCVCMHV